MGTNLSGIYAAVEAVDVVIGGEAATVWGLGTMGGKVNAADLPLRVVSPIGPASDPGTVGGVTLAAGTSEARWVVYDLLLLNPVTAGRAVKQYAAEVVAAVEAYVGAMSANYKLARGVRITGMTLDPGVYEYGDTSYFGVQVRLEITEILGG